MYVVFTEDAMRQFFNTSGLLEATLPTFVGPCFRYMTYHPLYFAEALVENPKRVANFPMKFSGVGTIAKVMAYGDYARGQNRNATLVVWEEAMKYPYEKKQKPQVKFAAQS